MFVQQMRWELTPTICPAERKGHKRRMGLRRRYMKAKQRGVIKDDVQEKVVILEEAHKGHIISR